MLTPAGTGAIATVAVAGPGAWAAVRTHFRPASGKPLPDDPPAGRVWFGTLGDGAADEVVVAVTSVDPEPCVEVHSHGGRRVVRWVVERFTESGCVEVPAAEWPEPAAADPRAVDPLTHAPTLRTASILLDQYHGAFRRAAIAALAGVRAGDGGPLRELARFAPVGRHLVEPWRVVVAGPPNVGKSSLVNALAGYQRAIVSPVAGTTRDAVAVSVAFDGWPVELTDTAGLRDAAEELEAAGIGLAKRAAAAADLTLWVVDASDPDPVWPDADGPLVVVNKTDRTKNLTPQPPSLRGKGGQSQESEPFFPPSLLGKGGRGVRFFLPVSALTGDGITALGDAIARALVPDPPPPGAGVPFTPALADAVERAAAAFAAGDISAAEALLVGCLDGPG